MARVEQCTFICTETQEEAGPDEQLDGAKAMYAKLHGLCRGAMSGRTMYVVPYLMGPPGSPLTKVGIELTDSIYVVLSMRIMTRMGHVACEQLGDSDDFNRGLHCMLDVNPDRRFIAIFRRTTRSSPSARITAATCCSAKNASRCASAPISARNEGWMAEHMLILGVESPAGEKTYVAAAFPSACGKTNFAMLVPPAHFKGWKIWTVGDDIAWMKPGPDGRLYAINPEAGYFGVVPGTNSKSNPNAMQIDRSATPFTPTSRSRPTAMSGGKARTARRRRNASTGRATNGRRTRRKKPRIPTAVSPRP